MAELDYDALKFWLDLTQWLLIVAMLIYGWIDHGRSANRRDITTIGRRQQDIDSRLNLFEEQLKHVPTHDDITRLREEVSGVRAKLDRVTTTLDRIHDYLMNNK